MVCIRYNMCFLGEGLDYCIFICWVTWRNANSSPHHLETPRCSYQWRWRTLETSTGLCFQIHLDLQAWYCQIHFEKVPNFFASLVFFIIHFATSFPFSTKKCAFSIFFPWRLLFGFQAFFHRSMLGQFTSCFSGKIAFPPTWAAFPFLGLIQAEPWGW